MAEDGAPGDAAQYWAFISYSHRDASFARRLHRQLEAYALPRRLVGGAAAQGKVPRRLTPIFRDREELPAAHDLSAEVRAALKASRSLIVVCSPAAAGSPWVTREIEVFRALNPGAPVLAAVRDGEPQDCFPQTLLTRGADGEIVEPLAADFRRGRDGEHLGLLKLVAGVVGLRLDELIQRDSHRRNQRVTAVTAGALAIALVMGLSALFALQARGEAERQRGEAEGLIEFMLTDLRDRLKGVGRLDVMNAVNARALRYYRGEDLKRLPVDSLERRARILHAMGEDDEERGDFDAALSKFREAARTTSVLLAESPGDPERIFDQAQSEYWIGSVDYARERYAAAKPSFLEYKRLAVRMVAVAPHSTKYRKEMGYAESNLCTLALQKPVNLKDATQHCSAALAQTELASRHPDKDFDTPEGRKGLDDDLMNCHANLADAYRAAGDPQKAMAERVAETAILEREMRADPKNADLKDTWLAREIALARLEKESGRIDSARARLLNALSVAESLRRLEPQKLRWTTQRDYILEQLDDIAHPRGSKP